MSVFNSPTDVGMLTPCSDYATFAKEFQHLGNITNAHDSTPELTSLHKSIASLQQEVRQHTQ